MVTILEEKGLDMQSSNSIFLAVYMITYNHENFIQIAIESILCQKTNFNFKLYIGEDCSTDRTNELCLKLKNEYPDKIELQNRTINVGPKKNAIETFHKCFESGAKYIALCEGDDYWTDPLKLQKQVDFMEANPEYSTCFHKVKILQNDVFKNDTSIEARYDAIKHYPATTLDLLEQGNFIHTPSVLFRNYQIKFPIEFQYSSVGDYFLHIINSQYGPIKRLDDVMAVYREGVGIYSSLSSINILKKTIIYQSCILSYLNEDVHKKIVLEKLLDNVNQLNKYNKSSSFIAETFSFKAIIKAMILKIKKSF